jgi:GT2 family glycosyltransferase
MKDFSYLIIIANFNGEKYLEVCLNSVLKTNYKNFDICIVDDGSADRSLEIINNFKKKDKINLLKQDHGGASKARNFAIKNYQDKYDFLVFLDNDTEVDKNWLTELNNLFNSDPNIDGAQSLLIDFDNRDRIQCGGIKLIPHVCWGVVLNQTARVGDFNQSLPCAAISAALAVKSDVFEKVGYFDEGLGVSTEDLDFTWRIWIAGFKIYSCPKSIVYHYSKSLEMRKDMNVNLFKQYFHITKNSFRSTLKNYSFYYLIYYFPFCIGINFIRALLVLIKRRDFNALNAFFSASIWNFKNIFSTLSLRSAIQKNRKVSDKYIYSNIMCHDSLLNIYEKNFKQTNLL